MPNHTTQEAINAALDQPAEKWTTPKTQREKILAILRERAYAWVPLPDILALGIAQYNARIYELRRDGYRIENKTQPVNGQRRSWYRLAV